MIKKFLLTLIAIVFINTSAFSNSCPVLYPELLEMWKNSSLSQDKKDAAKALIDKGWAMHQEVEETPDDDKHYEALEILFQAMDILEGSDG